MKNILTLIMACLVFVACKTQKQTPSSSNIEKETEVTEAPKSNRSFIIGEGGGFTGLYTMYKVQEDGLVFLYDEKNDTYKEIGNLSRSSTKDIFDTFDEINLIDYEYYKPGNMNYRIQISDEELSNSITWSDSHSPDENILFFYKKVMNEISALL